MIRFSKVSDIRGVYDFDDPQVRGAVVSTLSAARGMVRLEACGYRERRTDRQNRYYWPCFVTPFNEFLRAQGEPLDEDGEEAHELLKFKFLRRQIINKQTGEHIGWSVPSTTTLSTAEFNAYLDRVAAWLFHTFGIVVPDPSEYHEVEREAA